MDDFSFQRLGATHGLRTKIRHAVGERAWGAWRRDRGEIGVFEKSRQYTLRLGGLENTEGEIRSATLVVVLANLRRVAERVVRLRATGVATARGARPAWLARTVDFTVTGFGAGPITVGLRAPRLRETAAAEFGKSSPEDDDPPDTNLDDTALDRVSETVRAVRSADSPNDWVDRSVVEAIAALGRAAGEGAGFLLQSEDDAGAGFELDASLRARAEKQLARLPESRTCAVSGVLDRIQRDNGRFRLRLRDGRTLAGQLDPASLAAETLRALWGRRVTSVGPVHFHADGRPRVLVARRIEAQPEAGGVSERLPRGYGPGLPTIRPELTEKARKFDWRELGKVWVVEQSLEELLDELRDLRSRQ